MADRHPVSWPVVGHAPAFLRDKLGLLDGLARASGPVAEVRLGPWRALLLSSPADVRHVLVGNERNYEKTPRLTSPKGRTLSGHGLLTSSGAEHRRQRLLLQPLFHARVVGRFDAVVRETCERSLAAWPAAGELDLAHETARFARRVILVSLLGPELGADPALDAAVETRRRYLEHAFISLLPLRDRLPTPLRLAHVKAVRLLRETIDRAADDRLAQPADDLLSLLVSARYEDGSAMDRSLLLDEAISLLVTGFETTGDALAWTLYFVATHPEVERGLLAGEPELLQGVIAEALRLRPPTWLVPRVARAADELPGGTPVAAGASLYLSPWVVHRDPALYPEPERFDPGRERPRLAYFPFGSGPHVCLGEALTRMELSLAVAHLVPRLRIELAPDADATPLPRITLTPRRLVVRCSRRVA